MSDDTRYPCCVCCEPVRVGAAAGKACGLNDDHDGPCLTACCPGSVPVGPTKEGKQ